jgi:hypothetical protein
VLLLLEPELASVRKVSCFLVKQRSTEWGGGSERQQRAAATRVSDVGMAMAQRLRLGYSQLG